MGSSIVVQGASSSSVNMISSEHRSPPSNELTYQGVRKTASFERMSFIGFRLASVIRAINAFPFGLMSPTESVPDLDLRRDSLMSCVLYYPRSIGGGSEREPRGVSPSDGACQYLGRATIDEPGLLSTPPFP